jgi:pilus assembly protein CpaB
MNKRLLTILLVALVIAGGCAFLVYRMVGARMAAAKPVATTQIVAAAKDIPLGAVITTADLTTMTIAGTTPKGAILKPEDAVGRGVIAEISQGEPVIDSHLAGLGSGGGLAPTIPDGMRACAVRVDEVVGVSGFVLPGMRVDVLVSGNPPGAAGASEGMVTKTVLQNIQVLSAGTDIQKDATGKPQQVQVVNLLVTPDQAQTLSLASSLKIQLVLRNPLDTKVAKISENSMQGLFTDQNAPARPAAAPAPRKAAKHESDTFTVEVINGAKSSDEKFTTPGGTH